MTIKEAMDAMLARLGHPDVEYIEDAADELALRYRAEPVMVDGVLDHFALVDPFRFYPAGNYGPWPMGNKPAMATDEIKCDRKPADAPPEKRELERVREWQHNGPKADCPGASDPVYTPEGAIPPDCNRWNWSRGENCGNNDWRSKGFVRRDKKTGTIVDKEYEQKKRGQD